MKKHFIMTVTAVMLAVIMATLSPVQVFAAEQEIYISDIRMAHAEDSGDAKRELEEAGYTVVDADLNAETEDDFVYIGYKTTSDPDKAITDLKALKEKDGYTILNTKDIMGSLDGEAMEDAIYLKRIIDVFRENYIAGQNFAKSAYTIFQMYQYSDTQLLGDFLIDPALSANDLTDIVLSASPEMSTGLYQLLCAALIPDSGETCFTRFAAAGDTEPEVDQALKSKARSLLTSVKSYRSYVIEEILAASDKPDEGINTDVLMSSYLLESLPVGTDNLFLFLLGEEVTAEDLYRLAVCMTDAEIQAMKFLGFASFVNTSFWNESDILKSDVELADDEKADFWDGSTKQEYSRIAITNEVLQKMMMGDVKSFSAMITTAENIASYVALPLTYIAMGIASRVVSARLGIIAANAAAEAVSKASAAAANAIRTAILRLPDILRGATSGALSITVTEAMQTFRFAAQGIIEGVDPATGAVAYATHMMKNMPVAAQNAMKTVTYSTLRTAATATTAARVSIRAATAVLATTVVLTIIAILLTVVFFILDVVDYYSNDLSEFPSTVLSLEDIGDGERGYVYYQSVFDGDRVGDTNAYTGRAWNALFYTTSQSKVAPLRASSLMGTRDGGEKEGLLPVSRFGSLDAFDFNTNAYDHDCGTYIFFSRVNENTLASVFSEYSILFILIAVLLLGGAGTAVIVVQKKKKKAAAKAEDTTENISAEKQ